MLNRHGIVLWAFIWLLAVGMGRLSFSAPNEPQTPIIEPQVALEEGLVVQNNTLVGISYLPIIPIVSAVMISEDIDYCGIAWLSNFWPDYLVRDASLICEKESNGQQWRVNENWFGMPEISCGLFQINFLAHPEYPCEEMKDPIKNVLAAIKIYEKEGWKAWYNSAKKVGLIK